MTALDILLGSTILESPHERNALDCVGLWSFGWRLGTGVVLSPWIPKPRAQMASFLKSQPPKS